MPPQGGHGALLLLLCLRVDRGHVAQAALEAAAHLEEDALLWAGGELTAPPSGGSTAALELLAQAKACSQGQHGTRHTL